MVQFQAKFEWINAAVRLRRDMKLDSPIGRYGANGAWEVVDTLRSGETWTVWKFVTSDHVLLLQKHGPIIFVTSPVPLDRLDLLN